MDDVLYFAYGSNMLRQRLDARCPHVSPAGVAALADYRLTFDQYSRIDGSGKGGIEPEPGNVVYGVLWLVPPRDWPALDRAEGCGEAYERAQCTVTQADGRTRAVITYLPLQTRPGLRPWAWYLQLVIAGAVQHGLPDDYVARIRQVSCTVDPQAGRAARRTGLEALQRAGFAGSNS